MMVTDSDVELLLTFAEVAAAFIGLSAIAGILGRQTSDVEIQLASRLRIIAMVSVIILVAAFTPLLVARFEVENVWRTSSIILFPINLLGLYIAAKYDLNIQVTKADRLYMFLGYTLEVPVELLLIFNVLGILAFYAGAFYLTFVFLVLLQGALAFGMLVHSLLLQQQGVDDSLKSK